MDVVSTANPSWLQNTAILLGGLSLSYYLRQRAAKTHLPLPPSPKGWPILGNALDMPLKNMAEEYTIWGEDLDSDIISATALGKVVIVLNSIDKGSSRLWREKCFDYPFAMIPYNEKWKERRRMFVRHFRPGDTSIIYPQAREFVQRFLLELQQTPEDFFNVARGTTGAFIISLSYGFPIESRGNPHLEFAEATNNLLVEISSPGTNLIDTFPILKHLPTWAPGASSNRKAKELAYMSERFRSAPFDEAVSKFGTEEGRPSFVSVALGAIDDSRDDAEKQRQIIKDTAAMFYMAGTDTILASILNWVWTMLKYPGVQQEVHAELDEVLRGRMPDFEDQEQLPYLMATLMESTRLAPPAPISVPHLNTEDDVYGEYFIPKDSIIIPNLWAMLRNDNDYPDGTTFNPSRFLAPDGQINHGVRDPFTIAFGFGRRACPGGHIGRSMFWLAAASLATLFKWSEPLGEDGQPMNQPMDYDSGFIYQPKPFKCEFKVRSPEALTLLANMEGSTFDKRTT